MATDKLKRAIAKQKKEMETITIMLYPDCIVKPAMKLYYEQQKQNITPKYLRVILPRTIMGMKVHAS